jgi:two-component system, OmpR family, response regulator
MRILLVEDDPEISQRIVGRLAGLGFRTDHASDAEAALTWPQPEGIAAMIVDVGLPGASGIALIEQWRERGLRTPILILSARGSWQEKVEGLNAGGDDYVVKPVHAEEVAARLRAIMRRVSGHATARLTAGQIAVNPSTGAAWLGGAILDLTQIEARLLYLLVKHQDRALTWMEILDQLYPGAAERDRNNVEAHIARLRRKIGKNRIVTVRNRGYRLSAD